MTGNTYFVSGASRGLGLAITTLILENYEGSKVVAASRKPQESAPLKQLEAKYANRIHLVALDIENEDSVTTAAQQIEKIFPDGLDYVINNAGVSGSALSTAAALREVFNTNVVGTLLVTQALLPLVKKGSKKVVLNVSSGAGSNAMQQLVTDIFSKNGPEKTYRGYRISKAALNTLTVILSVELAQYDIKVISVHPGMVETDMYYATGGVAGALPAGEPTATESAKGQLDLLHKATSAESGKFFSWNGTVLPL